MEKNPIRRVYAVVATTLAVMFLGAGTSYAQTAPTGAEDIISTSATALKTELLAVVAAVAAVAVVFLAVRKGWRFLSSMVR